MPEIVVTIRNKIAEASVRSIVCDNTDYTVRLDCDEQWGEGSKIVYFALQGVGTLAPATTVDDVCAVPPIRLSDGVGRQLAVGVQQGSVKTSSAAHVFCWPSAEDELIRGIHEDDGVDMTWLEWVNANMAQAALNVETAQSVLAQAQAAADEAEQARDDAVSAKTDAETAAETAKQARDDAVSAKTAAETAAEAAESAKDGAETAKTAAQTAAVQAAASESSAGTSAASAGSSAQTAETAKTAAQTAASQAAASASSAGTSATSAESSKHKAELAENGAEFSQKMAEAARSGAEAAAAQAAESASSAGTSATSAGSSAQTAETAAETATAKASEASASASAASSAATTATEAKNTAQTAAQTATTKAGEASASAESVSASAAQIATNTEDIADLKTQLSKTEDAFVEYNVLNNIIERQTNVNWLRGTDLSITDGTWDIIKCAITPGIKYYFVKPYDPLSASAVRFADATNSYLGYISSFSSLIDIPENSAFVYVKCPIGSFPVAISETYYSNYAKGFKRSLIETYVEEAETAVNTANAVKGSVESLIIDSDNLADPSKFTLNKYMTETGAIGNSTSYYYTNKMLVSEGDVIYMSPSPRYKTAFNDDEVVDTTFSNPWTVPSGVNGLIITGYMASIDSLMVSKGKALPYIPYGNHINNDYLRIDNQNALNGNDGVTLTAGSLDALTTMELTAYPKGLATHDRLTGYCEFSTFGEIEFGYGYTSNYFVKVDATNIYKYYQGSVVGDPVPHGLTISDYLSFAIIMGNDRVATVTINTTSGSASTTFDIGYAKNGLPFIRSSTALSNVKLSAISADIRKSIWWFGDSYSSKASERVIGQLRNYGVVDNMLINAVPGMRSYYDANTGAYNDLVKLLALAKPKYIIWTLGMNDTEENYKKYLLMVKNICDTFGITLYAAKAPSVPNIDNTGKSAYIDSLGINAIDWATAVHATSAGAWYPGFLSNDNVHPTVSGAQAMATRTMVDCPAIMQFD